MRSNHANDQAAGLRRLLARTSSRVVTVVGARDGLGATSIVVNLATALGSSGKDVLVLDENLSQDNVANTLALKARYDLLNVVRGDKTWQDVMLSGPQGVRILPVARAIQGLAKLDELQRQCLLESLSAAAKGMDVVLVDAARDGHSVCASLSGDEPLLLVLNATASGITESYALLKQMAMHNGRQAFDIVVNKVSSEREAMAVFDNMSLVARVHLQVRLEYLGYIPVDEKLKRATQLGRSVIEAFPAAQSSYAIREVAQGLLRAPRVPEEEQDVLGSVMQRLMRQARPVNNRVVTIP
ncbi:MinD/ParA family ATP-binding protein [Sideroxydans lithotrophicus]|uniref:Putative MinD-related protein n=1 Tax=Sideroxydans lithotrophicus (strain ES-1) TaxID=580332 RepID=D5CMW2_SIDLE|nr:cellulose synthase operon protein YhjQ/BcsQ [Sideroxydans lithotrophicus]ADE10798.1 putative MinD-related protein [Sideroxydans lithotrophicus ES-1]